MNFAALLFLLGFNFRYSLIESAQVCASENVKQWYLLFYPFLMIKNSKMAPLWLVFENADIYGDPITIIYKQGDDLRQDVIFSFLPSNVVLGSHLTND